MSRPRLLDLFSGIGGFSLAASWAGYETVQFVEFDPFCQRVLRKHWPEVPIHGDIRTFAAHHLAGHVDLLTGGFPCQPWSVAGKQRGAADDRHLWPEMARVIDECRPRYVVAENVAGFIPMGLDDCLSDLEGLGYEARAVVLPACAVGAWHRRDRVWIIAAHAESGGAATAEQRGQPHCAQSRCQVVANAASSDGDWWQFESGVRGVPDGLSVGMAGRAARLKALGNAIVPQVAYEIIRHLHDTS